MVIKGTRGKEILFNFSTSCHELFCNRTPSNYITNGHVLVKTPTILVKKDYIMFDLKQDSGLKL